MSEQKYYQSADELIETRPEINPEWKEFIGPVFQANDDDFFNFVMSFVFM